MIANYYALKFARMKKDKPTDWIIIPDGYRFRLVRVPRSIS